MQIYRQDPNAARAWWSDRANNEERGRTTRKTKAKFRNGAGNEYLGV